MQSGHPAFAILVLIVLLSISRTESISAQDMEHSRPTAPSTYLKIEGLHGQSAQLSPEEFSALPHAVVSVFNSHSKVNEKYSGVLLSELLAKVGVPSGEEIRGKLFLLGIVAEGTDKYDVLYSLAEVEPSIHTGQVIVADAVNDHRLEKDGMFKLVSTEEKRPARWVRNLSSITVIEVKP